MAAELLAAAVVTTPANAVCSVLLDACGPELCSPAHHTRSGWWRRTGKLSTRGYLKVVGGWVGLRPYFSSTRGVDKKRRAVCFRKARCSGGGDTVRADLLGIRPALVWNCSACAGFAVELRVRFHLLVLAIVQVKVKAARCQE